LTRARFKDRIVSMPETAEKTGSLEKLLPILLVALVGLSFVVGILWQKVKDMESGGNVVSGEVQDLGDANLPIQGKLSEEQAAKVPAISDDDHVRGSRDAKVFLVEYSDYECPFCQSFHGTAKQALIEYGDQMAWVFRHFPLTSIHSMAQPTAEAAECASELGGGDAFWDFTDQVFEAGPQALSDESTAAIAAGLGLNPGEFTDCVEGRDYQQKVEDQQNAGFEAGVTGTPGNFIVNSKGEVWLVPGALPFNELQPIIDEALAS